jgi:16S rRNA (adenine1518-N6/adenine1519-N6)-dimethyltransferase
VHPREQLDGTGVAPKKSFGQNFLADERMLASIARLALDRAKDPARTVLEMGGGLGALTHHLLQQGANVVVIERDRDLVPLLKQRFDGEPRLTVLEDNALTVDLSAVAMGGCVAGNLPYHHAADLALRLLHQWPRLGGGCFLVQLEVAKRMAARPGSKDFSSLSVVLQSRFNVRCALTVAKGAFWPPPDVHGGVVTFDPLPAPRGAEHTLDDLERVVRPAFQKRRKTLHNSLKGIVDDDVLIAAGVAPTARPEDVPVDAWGRLAASAAKRTDSPTQRGS